jgi:hypothetical protein
MDDRVALENEMSTHDTNAKDKNMDSWGEGVKGY